MSKKSKEAAPTVPPIKCDLCNERFVDEDTFDAHQRSEKDRYCASNKFLRMPDLPKCLSAEALWAIGWRKSSTFKTAPDKSKVWTMPPMPKLRAHSINPDSTYQCLFCKSHFRDATVFKSHYVNTFTDVERCMDRDELKALDYEQSSSGVWRATLLTQLLPSQAARLPTVRRELERFNQAESLKRDFAEAAAV